MKAKKSNSLRTRFVLIFTVLTLASNVMVLALVSWQTLHTNNLQMRDSLSLSFEQTYSYLQSIVHGASLCSEALYRNPAVLDTVDAIALSMNPGDEYRAYLSVNNALAALSVNEEYVVHLYLPDTFRYAGSSASLRSLNDKGLPTAIAGLPDGSEQAVWLTPRDVDGAPMVALFRQVMCRSDFSTPAAYEEVALPLSALDEVLARSIADDGSFACLFNARGERIALQGGASLNVADVSHSLQNAVDDVLTLGGERFCYERRSLENTDWTLVIACPLSALLRQNNRVGVATWLLLLPVLAFSTWLVHRFSHRLFKRIERLSDRMRYARKNGLTEPPRAKEPPDELGQLQDQFTYLLSEIKRLMDKQKQDGEKLRAAELRALQAQINPHFLYNTLDLIRWEALESDAVEISEIVTALADYYRAALSNGPDVSTLQREAELVANYVKIQNLRFDGRILYAVEIPQRLRERPIPRLTLQPLVENAVLHGLSPDDLSRRIHIRVSACEENGSLWVRVADDGRGMSREQLARILEIDHSAKPTHYAVGNVHSRIGLFYGERYGLHYQSEEGHGTTVSIELPIKP